MDAQQAVSDSNGMVASAVALVTILVAQWEALARMKNVVLYWTVVVAAVTHFVYAIGSAFITRDLARNPDFDSYYYKTMWFATLDLLCWFALIYHTCYRALLLTRSNMEGLWIVPTTVVAIQAVLQSFGLWFWYDNLSTNPSDTTPQNYWFGLGTLIFIPTVATGFFLLTQSAIIHTLPSGAPRCEVPPSQTAKMVCKTICAASTVVLEYITIRGYFFPATSALAFIYQAPNMMILLLLSDGIRVEEILDYQKLAKQAES